MKQYLSEQTRQGLMELRRHARAEAQARKRRDEILDRASRHETWLEVKLSCFPIKGKR